MAGRNYQFLFLQTLFWVTGERSNALLRSASLEDVYTRGLILRL